LINAIEWKTSNNLVEYNFAVSEMKKRILEIKKNSACEMIWLLEHNSIFTGGTSAKIEDLKNNNINFLYTGRGGQWTWHGPGQRVVYLMLNLKNRLQDVKAYVYALEELIILTLKDFHIEGVRTNGQPGVWVKDNNRCDKIAALGIRISSWITFHGISINVNPNLDEFNNIVPCGIKNSGVTSFYKLGNKISLSDLDISLKKNFNKVFGSEGSFKLK
jgi:lipoyl(octanoyl) transferase